MTNKINTYEKLGRFMMNQVYNILLSSDSHKIEYQELKHRIKKQIDNNPNIDKKFAMQKYSHGSATLVLACHTWKKTSTEYLSTYRWENVLYYYLVQHHKAAFTHFEYWRDKNGIHDYIILRDDYLYQGAYSVFFRVQPDMDYMFDKAQQLNGRAAEKLLLKSKYSRSNRTLAEFRLIADEGILSIYEHSIHIRCK